MAVALALIGADGAGPSPPPVHRAFGHGPTVVLVHGLGSGANDWLPTARRLAKHHRVVLVDLPGHGESAMPAPFSLECAGGALAVALECDVTEPFVLVGHSLGGLVAATAALEHPAHLRGLVLVETALQPQVSVADRQALLASLDRDYTRLLHAAYLDFGQDSAQGEALYARVARLDPAIVKPWIRLAWTADLSRQAAGLEVPVLVVLAPRSWSEGEPWNTAATALGYAHVPHLKAVRLEGCGHFVMLDRPAELARLIERFTSEVMATPVATR